MMVRSTHVLNTACTRRVLVREAARWGWARSCAGVMMVVMVREAGARGEWKGREGARWEWARF